MHNQKSRIIVAIVVALVACLPVTGFVYGVVACKDCGGSILSQTVGRLFIGLVGAVLTSITFGKPWTDEGGNASVNLRAYVALAFLCIAAALYFLRKEKE